MTIPAWPDVNSNALVDGWSWIPYGDPIVTEMDRGNVRQRQAPGINIATTTFGVMLTQTEYTTFKTWLVNTVNRGTSRFTMDIWDGSQIISGATVQFSGKPQPQSTWPVIVVTMTLLVFNG